MNGSAFGGFAEGFANGINGAGSLVLMARKAGKKKKNDDPDMDTPASGSTAAGYTGELSKFQATPNGSVGAEDAAPKPQEGGDILSGSWSTLKGIVGGLAGGAELGSTPAGGIIESGMKNSIAGKLLGGGIGNTIIGKLGGDKLLSKGLGGLLK